MTKPNYIQVSSSSGTLTPTATLTNTPTRTFTPTALTRTPTRTPTATVYCPALTAEPLWVEPVTSPTSLTTQVITVRAGNSDSVTVTGESGSFTVTGNFSTSSPALVTISLNAGVTHHLTVSAHIKGFNSGSCQYTGYTLTTTVDRYGSPLTIVQQSQVTTATFTPTPTRTYTPTSTSTGGATCTVTYTNQNDWGSGFTANVVITNNGSTAINGWTLTWNFTGNQVITNTWSANINQSGTLVTVTNLSYNAIIAANGGSVSFGFNATYSGRNDPPINVKLNGLSCR